MRRDIVAHAEETVFRHHSVFIYKEFGVVALRQGILGNPVVGQRVVIVRNG